MIRSMASMMFAACVLTPGPGIAQEVRLFNGRNLDGWTYKPQVTQLDKEVPPVEEVWIVRDGMLISTNAGAGYLMHERQFENYELTFEWRSMKVPRNGLAVGGSGAIFINAVDEEGSFKSVKSIEVGVFNSPGGVYFRDVKPFSKTKWAFRAEDFTRDAEKDMGEWNRQRIICRGKRLTVYLNGQAVNQVDGLTRTKGQVFLQSARAAFQAPSFYRNISVRPLSPGIEKLENEAAVTLAKGREAAAKRDRERVARREAEEQAEKMREAAFDRMWAKIDVTPDTEFSEDVLALPFPKDAAEIEFQAAFGDVELQSRQSMQALSKFYRTEMARRGWKETEKERDDDSIEVTFKRGKYTLELDLDQKKDGVEVSLDCRGLSFDRTQDPAGLAAAGLAQPAAYLALQKELKLPGKVSDLEYNRGDGCSFKSDLALQKTFDDLCGQLRRKGYRETRRPIASSNRRYTEFGKGRAKISVNVFSHPKGSRGDLRYTSK